MKAAQLLIILCSTFSLTAQAAMDHSQHRGGSGQRSMDSSGGNCIHPHFDKITPPHLSTISAGGEFSFVVIDIDDPDQISVVVKKQPVEITTEFKDPYYIVKGKIPADLKNTAARVDVKIDSKYHACRAEHGWLLKIADK